MPAFLPALFALALLFQGPPPQDWASLDRQAEALYTKGDLKEAIRVSRLAVDAASGAQESGHSPRREAISPYFNPSTRMVSTCRCSRSSLGEAIHDDGVQFLLDHGFKRASRRVGWVHIAFADRHLALETRATAFLANDVAEHGMQPDQEMVERPGGNVQTVGRILAEVVFDRRMGG